MKLINCLIYLSIVTCYTQAIELNDLHSQLNKTTVSEIQYPTTTQQIIDIINKARTEDKKISISGGMHAMGGQQFGTDTININMSKMNRVLAFDPKNGTIKVEAGIEWPALIDYLVNNQKENVLQWGIIQKQTGADRLSIGGALSANIHGRGLNRGPIVEDVIGFTLVNAKGDVLHISRNENSNLFKLAIGGYGLFGVITSVELRLQPRVKVQRIVEITDLEDFTKKIDDRIKNGYIYGDFQYNTDDQSNLFMQKGVFASYKPIAANMPITILKEELAG